MGREIILAPERQNEHIYSVAASEPDLKRVTAFLSQG